MGFKITWETAKGRHESFISASALGAVEKITKCGMWNTPRLRIRTATGVAISLDALADLAVAEITANSPRMGCRGA